MARTDRGIPGESPLISSGTIFNSLLAGVIAGLASGFLGVSPGGILVPVISLLLPFSQHVVQGISLVVQAPPTSVSALAAYFTKRSQNLNCSHRACFRRFYYGRTNWGRYRKDVLRTGTPLDVCGLFADPCRAFRV